MTAETDVIDAISGILPGSAAAAVRARRPDVVRLTQGSHDALLAPADPAGVSLVERALIALHVATLERHQPLAAHYRRRLEQVTAEAPVDLESPRLKALLAHVNQVTTAPRTVTKTALDALRAQGFSPRDLVTIAQLAAFVTYQGRVAAGLMLLARETPP